MIGKVAAAGIMIVCCGIPTAGATSRQQPKPKIFLDLLECRSIPDSAARLTCFDRHAAQMEDAAKRDEVVVLDKGELNKTRKTLFGFSFPKLPFLGGGDDDTPKDRTEDGLSHIEAEIASARSLGYGQWQFQLEDGAWWMTTEAMSGRQPKVGQKIEIHRAAMGSFMGKVDGGRAVRMKRVG